MDYIIEQNTVSEFSLVAKVLKEQNKKVTFLPFKKFSRLSEIKAIVIGNHKFMACAFKKLKVDQKQLPSCYPPPLLPFLKRKIWSCQIRDLPEKFEHFVPTFVKPCQSKLFTGFVCTDASSIRTLGPSTKIYCSEVVSFASAEFRVFVCEGKILETKKYGGKPGASAILDTKFVQTVVDTFEKSKAPVAYALDFGILDSGETALIEFNDAFALGAYGLDPETYIRMLILRWKELTSNSIS